MNRLTAALFLTPLVPVLMSNTIAAAQDRETATPVEHRTFWNHDVSQVSLLIGQGYRLSDLEVMPTSPIRFSGTAVKNTGDYATSWWWYYGVTKATVEAKLAAKNARLIDIERYVVNGSVRYAVVMVDNTGKNYKKTQLFTGVTYANFVATLQGTGMRLIDIECYTENRVKKVDMIGIDNKGADARAWWYYIDYSLPFINNKIAANKARPIDIEILTSGQYACLMVRDDVTPWWQFAGVSFATVLAEEKAHHARTIDYEFYLDGGTPKALALMVDNFENFISHGAGCKGRPGVAMQTKDYGHAMLGEWTGYACSNLVPLAKGFMNIGAKRLNIHLGVLGMPGCFMLTDDLATLPTMANGSGVAKRSLYFPNNPSFLGIRFHTQFFSNDPTTNALGGVTSNALRTEVRQ